MSMHNEAEAHAAGEVLLAQLEGTGWELLYSNYRHTCSAVKGPLRITPCGDRWTVHFDSKYLPDTSNEWRQVGTFKDPNEAVKAQLAAVRRYVERLQDVIEEAEVGLPLPYEVGSDNVFADLGLPDSAELLEDADRRVATALAEAPPEPDLELTWGELLCALEYANKYARQRPAEELGAVSHETRDHLQQALDAVYAHVQTNGLCWSDVCLELPGAPS